MKQRFLLKMVLVAAGLFMGLNGAWAGDEWSIDFAAVGANYNDKTGVTISSTVATIGGTTMGTCTVESEALNSNFVLQTGTTWLMRKANGLYQGNGGGRAMGMLGCTAGQIITIVGTGNPNPSTNVTLKYQDGNTYVYTVNADGNVKFTPARYLYFTSISVANPSATAVEYTVKYVDENGTEIKDATKGEGEVGASITLTSSETASFKNDAGTIKYIYKSDDSEGQTIAEDGSTVVTITFREAATYTYSVANNLGDAIASGSAFEGDNVYFYVSYFVFKDGRFYQSPSLSSGTLSYGQGTISAIAANTEITVTYTEEENTNVVFFSEAENLDGVTAYEDNNVNGRMSNGKVGYFEEQTAIANLPAGVYTITSSSRYGTTTFTAGETEVYSLTSTGAVTTTTSEAFTLTEATDINVGAGDTKNYFDYVIIRKTAEVATITTADYATFVPTMKVAVPDEVKAYYVNEIINGKAQMEEVTVIPANTPVIIYKKVDTDTRVLFAPTDDDASKVEGNLLNYSDAETVADGTQYILADGEDGVGFYKAASESTIAARKAYLEISAAASFLSFNFDDETTGIEKVENAAVNANGTMFNLAGQRVAQPTKGLYIVNGKKVVVK